MYDLDRDGFTFLKGVIPKRLIEETQKCARDILCSSDLEAIISGLAKGGGRLWFPFARAIADCSPSREISMIPEIKSLAESAIPGVTYMADCAAFVNAPGGERLTYDWHSEKSYFPNAEEVVTLFWYPWLRPVNDENGTMVMARGSHLKTFEAVCDPVVGGLTQMRVKDEDLADFDKVPCDLDLGDVCLFKLRTVHKTMPNKSEHPRVSMVMRYADWEGRFNSGWGQAA